MYTDEELAALGFDALHLGEPGRRRSIVQADHAEYASLGAESFPGAKVVVDGRRVLDRERFAGTSFLVVGQPADIV